MQNQKNLNYIMYCRKSTDNEDRQIQSIEDQIRELKNLALVRGVKIVKVMQESQSAKKPGRPVFSEMINMIYKGEANGIICWKINRLARNPKDGGDIQWMLQQNNIKSILTPGREYLPTDNVLMMSVELGMANQFILDLSKDVKRGMDSKVKKGWRPGIAPLGYLNDKAGEQGDKKLFIDPVRFPIMRKMWDLMLTGNYTISQTIKKANDEWGLRTVDHKRRASSKLALSTGYKIFTNPFYCGEFTWLGEIYEGKHTAMVTNSEFDKVQFILGKDGKPRSKTKNLPFNSIITCGDCGCMITADEKQKRIKTTGEIKSYIYHRFNKRKKDKPCYQKPIKSEEIIELIKEQLDNINIPQEYLDWAIKAINESQEKEASNRDIVLANLQKNYNNSVDRINTLIQNFISPNNKDRSLITDDEMKEQKAVLQKEKSRIKSKIDNLDKDFDEWVELTERTFKFATYAKYWFEKGDFEVKNNILKTLGSNFVLKDGKLNIYLAKPFEIIQNTFKFKIPKNDTSEPSKVLINKGQNAPCESAFPVMSGCVEDVRTFLKGNLSYVYTE